LGSFLPQVAAQPVRKISHRLHQKLAVFAVFDVVHDVVFKAGAHNARHQSGQEGVRHHLAVRIAIDHRLGRVPVDGRPHKRLDKDRISGADE